jgi:hypothetical protein
MDPALMATDEEPKKKRRERTSNHYGDPALIAV